MLLRNVLLAFNYRKISFTNLKSSMTTISCLAVASIDSSPSLLFSSETSRVLINVPEGCQRLCVEYKVRLSKLNVVCITNLAPECLCGLPGLILTAVDAGKTSLTVLGPVGIRQFWRTTKYFMHRPDLRLNIIEVIENFTLNIEDNVTLHCIPFGASSHISYVFASGVIPGKFNIKRAQELKIPSGPLYGQLKNGMTVVLDDGRVISPSELLGPAESSRYCAVIFDIYKDRVAGSIIQEILKNDFFGSFNSTGSREGLLGAGIVLYFSWLIVAPFLTPLHTYSLYESLSCSISHGLPRCSPSH